jgi:hypothetical protein
LEEKKAATEVDAELCALKLEAEDRGSVICALPRETESRDERTEMYVRAGQLQFSPGPEVGSGAERHSSADPCDLEPPNNSQLSEFSRFLLKKDLMMSRLRNFDDKSESFVAWKVTFQNVTKELDVSTDEEIDLLIKFLSPESSRHANSIKTANYHNPDRCCHRIWERLNDKYGSQEMVKSALKQKLLSISR